MKDRPHDLLAPSTERIADNRPVMNREQMLALGQRVLAMATADDIDIQITHTASSITRMSNGRILTSDDGDEVKIWLTVQYGNRRPVRVSTNQINETALQEFVRRCEITARAQLGGDERIREVRDVQDTYIPVTLWHTPTITAMTEARENTLPTLLGNVVQRGMRAAGFVGIMAKSMAFLSNENIVAYYDETDSEVTVTARTSDGKSSGWAGQAARDWSKINVTALTTRACDIAHQWVGVKALEPGRRTAILTPEAVAPLFRFFAEELDGGHTRGDEDTIFSKPTHRARYNERLFDERITMSSDPNDPEGGFAPFFKKGYANPATTWVDRGVLKDLAFDQYGAMMYGRRYSQPPSALRVSGGTTEIEQMIAQCEEGVLVHRFSGVNLINRKTMMMTGVTRDGCFFIQRGKIVQAVKNFRFLESPAFMLNKVLALGVPRRAAYGFTPPGVREREVEWPRRPMIVPPMMVQDFNFSALADAV